MQKRRKKVIFKTRETLIRELSKAKPDLKRRFRLRSMALFGSWARGEQRPDSDVDILVDVDPRIGLDFVVLADTLEQLLGIPVEVVSRRAIHSRHWEYIADDLIYV